MYIADLRTRPVQQVPLAFVDVETTGLSPRYGDRVCEIAVVTVLGGREIGRFSTLVNPGRPISPGAAAVNRITDQMVRGAPTFDAIAVQVASLLDGRVFVAHNAPFDLGFLSSEFQYAGLPCPQPLCVDTLELARGCYRFPSNRLSTIATLLGIGQGGHRALGDALVTWQVFKRFVDDFGGPESTTLEDLLSRQLRRNAATIDPSLAKALQAGQRMRIVYGSSDGTRTERRIDPIALTNEGDLLLLVAYCHLRQQERTFRVDRIISWHGE